jgi:hypothetical protein
VIPFGLLGPPAVTSGDNSRSCKEFFMAHLANELWIYLRVRKRFWLALIIVSMVLLGTLIIFAQGSALAPFIYSIF